MQKMSHSGRYESVTYKQALEDVNGLGTALIAGGLKGKRISVIGENSYSWAISYLAIVCGTGIVVPIDKELSKDEITNIIKKADVVIQSLHLVINFTQSPPQTAINLFAKL